MDETVSAAGDTTLPISYEENADEAAVDIAYNEDAATFPFNLIRTYLMTEIPCLAIGYVGVCSVDYPSQEPYPHLALRLGLIPIRRGAFPGNSWKIPLKLRAIGPGQVTTDTILECNPGLEARTPFPRNVTIMHLGEKQELDLTLFLTWGVAGPGIPDNGLIKYDHDKPIYSVVSTLTCTPNDDKTSCRIYLETTGAYPASHLIDMALDKFKWIRPVRTEEYQEV